MKEGCSFCGNKNFREDKIQYVYRSGEKMMLVENVPAEVCEFCKEPYFRAEVLMKIEKDFLDIENNRKKPASMKSVPVEEFELVV